MRTLSSVANRRLTASSLLIGWRLALQPKVASSSTPTPITDGSTLSKPRFAQLIGGESIVSTSTPSPPWAATTEFVVPKSIPIEFTSLLRTR